MNAAKSAWSTPELLSLNSGAEAEDLIGKSQKHQNNTEISGGSCGGIDGVYDGSGKGCPGPNPDDPTLGPS